MATLEIEESEQAQALYALIGEDDKRRVREVLTRVEQADLIPEQTLLIQLNVITGLQEKVKAGASVAETIGDSDAFADAAIAEIGEAVRQSRHIGALMGGLAICAFVLLLVSGVGLVRGLIAGRAVMTIMSTLNLGHVLCFIAVLASCLVLVMGDKKASYNDPKKMRTRTQIVGLLFIAGFVALQFGIFGNLTAVLTVPALYLLIASLVMLVLWKLSGRL